MKLHHIIVIMSLLAGTLSCQPAAPLIISAKNPNFGYNEIVVIYKNCQPLMPLAGGKNTQYI